MTPKDQSRMPRRRWGSGRGALVLIALFLVLSAVLRMATGSGAAIALEMKERAESALNSTRSGETEADGVVNITPDLIALLEDTKAREEAVSTREAELEARAQALALVEASIAEDLQRLEEAEAKLRATMATADAAAETDIDKLTAVYENMKPDQASALFQLMEPSFAAGFLGRMRADAAAQIMAGLTPDLAYTISAVLAGRNAEVPREPVPEPREETRDQ